MAGIDCTAQVERYVSLDISRDSEDDKFRHTWRKCQSEVRDHLETIGNVCIDPESLAHFSVPTPISQKEVRELSEALMGEYEDQFYSEGALVGLPRSKNLSAKLRFSKVRKKLLFSVGDRKIRPFLPLLIKAEISPLFAVSEVLLTWIAILSLLQIVFWGAGVATTFAGGFALFTALNILQFWYGFSRYSDLDKNVSSGMLAGKAVDPQFEQIRDICSFHCNGDYRRRNQTAAVLVALPFTLFNHICSVLVDSLANRFIDPESGAGSSPWGIYTANVLLTGMWLAGGPMFMAFALMTLIFNQHLYNSLLFRRGYQDFFISLVFGNFVSVQRGVNSDIVGVETRLVLPEIDLVPVESSICESRDLLNCPPKSVTEIDKPSIEVTEAPKELVDASLQGDSLFEGLEGGQTETQPQPEPESGETGPGFILTVAEGVETRSLQDDSLTCITDFVSKNSVQQAAKLSLNPEDVFFEMENHLGTIAWRNTILEATQKFPGQKYTFRKHNWVLRKLARRNFYTKVYTREGSIWQQVNPVDVKKRCKGFFEKQAQLHGYITDIVKDLKTLRKTHKEDNGSRKRQGSKDETEDTSKRKRLDALESEVTRTKPNTFASTKKIPRRLINLTGFARRLKPSNWNKKNIAEEDEGPSDHTRQVKNQSPNADRMGQLEVYLGLNDNQGFQTFVQVVKQAGDEFNSEEYTCDMHDWVIPRIDASNFFIKTNFGTYRDASGDEIRQFAQKCFKEERDEHFRRIQAFVEEVGNPISVVESALNGPNISVDVDREQVENDEEIEKKGTVSSSEDRSTVADLEGPAVYAETLGCIRHTGDIMMNILIGPNSTEEKEGNDEERDELEEKEESGKSRPHEISTPRAEELDSSKQNQALERREEETFKGLHEEYAMMENHNPAISLNRKISPSDYSRQWRKDASKFLENKPDSEIESLTRFIGDQTKSRRGGSKFFASLWSRAARRQGKTRGQQYLVSPLDVEAKEVLKAIGENPKKLRVNGFVQFDSKSTFTEHKSSTSKARATSRLKGTLPPQPSDQIVYDQVMSILEEDYLRAKHNKTVGSMPTDNLTDSGLSSVSEGLGRTIGETSSSLEDSADDQGDPRLEPSSIMEFIAQKIEEEYDRYNCNGFFQTQPTETNREPEIAPHETSNGALDANISTFHSGKSRRGMLMI